MILTPLIASTYPQTFTRHRSYMSDILVSTYPAIYYDRVFISTVEEHLSPSARSGVTLLTPAVASLIKNLPPPTEYTDWVRIPKGEPNRLDDSISKEIETLAIKFSGLYNALLFSAKKTTPGSEYLATHWTSVKVKVTCGDSYTAAHASYVFPFTFKTISPESN